jgi:hypothetical protein
MLLDVLKPQSFHKEEGYSQLLRAGTAALLNASFHEVNHLDIFGPGDIVYYPLYSTEQMCIDIGTIPAGECSDMNVVSLVNAALGDVQAMLDLAEILDSYNNGIHWINWGEGGPLP